MSNVTNIKSEILNAIVANIAEIGGAEIYFCSFSDKIYWLWVTILSDKIRSSSAESKFQSILSVDKNKIRFEFCKFSLNQKDLMVFIDSLEDNSNSYIQLGSTVKECLFEKNIKWKQRTDITIEDNNFLTDRFEISTESGVIQGAFQEFDYQGLMEELKYLRGTTSLKSIVSHYLPPGKNDIYDQLTEHSPTCIIYVPIFFTVKKAIITEDNSVDVILGTFATINKEDIKVRLVSEITTPITLDYVESKDPPLFLGAITTKGNLAFEGYLRFHKKVERWTDNYKVILEIKEQTLIIEPVESAYSKLSLKNSPYELRAQYGVKRWTLVRLRNTFSSFVVRNLGVGLLLVIFLLTISITYSYSQKLLANTAFFASLGVISTLLLVYVNLGLTINQGKQRIRKLAEQFVESLGRGALASLELSGIILKKHYLPTSEETKNLLNELSVGLSTITRNDFASVYRKLNSFLVQNRVLECFEKMDELVKYTTTSDRFPVERLTPFNEMYTSFINVVNWVVQEYSLY